MGQNSHTEEKSVCSWGLDQVNQLKVNPDKAEVMLVGRPCDLGGGIGIPFIAGV